MVSPWNTTWPRQVPSILFCQGSMHHHRPHATSGNNQQGHGLAVPEFTVHHAVHSPVYGAH